MNEIEMELMSLTVRPSDLRKSGATTKHNGINATRERLKDQLVLAANENIRLRAALLEIIDICERPTFMDRLRLTAEVAFQGFLQPFRDLARLARWVRGLWS